MGLSRGASALGVALALGEIDAASLSDADIGQNFALWFAAGPAPRPGSS